MRYLIWGSAAAAAVVLILWYQASSVVDNDSMVAILAALSCGVALLVSLRLRRS